MSPETMMGIASLVIFLIGGFIGYLFGKGRISIKTKLLERKIETARMFLDACKDKSEEEIKELIKKIKRYLEER